MDNKKPFKTVKTEYYKEDGIAGRVIKVVTTTKEWVGSAKDPVISTSFVYL
tara:strand:- start:1250 stop:1402 length:153 start_codon:yes stop_codon:yes gene_type:complete